MTKSDETYPLVQSEVLMEFMIKVTGGKKPKVQTLIHIKKNEPLVLPQTQIYSTNRPT